MADQYNSSYQSTTTTSRIGPDQFYLRSVPGILKLVEMGLCLIAFICACILPWGYLGGGWVQFVTISAFVCILLLFIFHFMQIISRLPGPMPFIEFIYYAVYTILMIIAAIVAACRAPYGGSIVAAAIFSFAAAAVMAIDTFMMYRGWQAGQHADGGTMQATTVTTTTSTSSYATKEQY